MDGDEERQPPTDNVAEVLQGAAEDPTHMERQSSVRAQSDVPTTDASQTLSHPQTSASIYMTVLPCETGFD